MKAKMYVVIFVLLVFVFLDGVLAKGVFPKVVITGRGIDDPIVVVDETWLVNLSMTGLMVIPDETNEPSQTGTGFELLRGGDQGDTFVPFDHLIYYPTTSTGQPAIYYVGLVNGWSEYDGKWFGVTEEGDAAMRQILAANDVQVDSSLHTAPFSPEEFAALVMRLNFTGIAV